eukprot:TRINITY_DN5566_c0_g1_i1.p1 TRINITY_DN5566_c0_g1~~TRINITY_DN5566_c0_g1_i1.p1  ORF type:complete len:656 (-),score=232.35 TRINITY_DN5566_c0_g1_i1:26-1993(-)
MDSGLLDKTTSFASLGLDARLIKALNKVSINHPTVIQSQSLPTTLSKRDVLLCSSTGSGKTLAYVLPVIHNILKDLERGVVHSDNEDDDDEHVLHGSSSNGIQAVILVPTRELTRQVGSVISQMVSYCWDKVDVVDLSGDFNSAAEGVRLKEGPKIVVGTPGKIVNHCRLGNMTLKTSLQYLVVDEADLLLSFGYDGDIKELLTFLPKLHHTMLMSATLSPEVDALKRLVLNKPAIFKLKQSADMVGADKKDDGDDEEEEVDEDMPKISMTVNHLYLDLTENDQKDAFLYVYTMVKLKAIKGKTLFFVNDIETGYKLKLFFEAFSIQTALLNAELPVRTRLDTVKQFNNGTIDFLIATDKGLEEGYDQVEHSYDDDNDGEGNDEDGSMRRKKKRGGKIRHDKEFGVSRGVDFQGVMNVVNFTFPTSLKSYVHRVGRTGRGGEQGNALSIITRKDIPVLKKVQEYYRLETKAKSVDKEGDVSMVEDNGEDEDDLKKTEDENNVLKPFQIRYKDVSSFKYRVEDIMRGINAQAVKSARLKEIHLAMLRSEKLKAHFEDNPREKELLQVGTVLRPRQVQAHLQAIPRYLVPKSLESLALPASGSRRNKFAPPVRSNQRKKFKQRNAKFNPLKTFKSSLPQASKTMRQIPLRRIRKVLK